MPLCLLVIIATFRARINAVMDVAKADHEREETERKDDIAVQRFRKEVGIKGKRGSLEFQRRRRGERTTETSPLFGDLVEAIEYAIGLDEGTVDFDAVAADRLWCRLGLPR